MLKRKTLLVLLAQLKFAFFKNCFSMVLKASTKQRTFNILQYTIRIKKGTREFK